VAQERDWAYFAQEEALRGGDEDVTEHDHAALERGRGSGGTPDG